MSFISEDFLLEVLRSCDCKLAHTYLHNKSTQFPEVKESVLLRTIDLIERPIVPFSERRTVRDFSQQISSLQLIESPEFIDEQQSVLGPSLYGDHEEVPPNFKEAVLKSIVTPNKSKFIRNRRQLGWHENYQPE